MGEAAGVLDSHGLATRDLVCIHADYIVGDTEMSL